MKNLRFTLIIAIGCLASVDGALAAAPYNSVGNVPVPGGITLVPGTVVTPQVSGTNATGTVPLAGTIGSPGVGNPNPSLGNVASPTGTDTGALYPPAIYPQLATPGPNQSTLPQTIPNALSSGNTTGAAPPPIYTGSPADESPCQ